MVKAKKIAVCIDSSLLLAEVFGNETHSSRSGNIEKLEKIFPFKKYMSETVKKEVENRLKVIICLIGDVSKEFISDYRAFKGVNPKILLSDLPFIESFFKNLKSKYPVNKSERQIIENIESVLVNYLIENSHKKNPPNIPAFVVSAMVEFNKISSKIQFDFLTKSGGYKILPKIVNPATCQKLRGEPKLQKTVQRKPDDIQILCEVEAFQQSSEKKCLLATLDHKDMLNNSSLIESLIGIKCLDPLYLANEFP
jgi:hypothetical protein